jgi:hypothetical protein
MPAACAALLCLALLPNSQAQPPPQCYWGQPTYTSRVGPYDVSIKIRVHCGGACSCGAGKAAHCNAHGHETMERR